MSKKKNNSELGGGVKNKALAYGSLYMDEGEGWGVVIDQLNHIMLPNVVGLFFDVIDWELKRKRGEIMSNRIKGYVKKHYPNLEITKIDYVSTEKTGENPKN
jgi:hypothetical protein